MKNRLLVISLLLASVPALAGVRLDAKIQIDDHQTNASSVVLKNSKSTGSVTEGKYRFDFSVAPAKDEALIKTTVGTANAPSGKPLAELNAKCKWGKTVELEQTLEEAGKIHLWLTPSKM